MLTQQDPFVKIDWSDLLQSAIKSGKTGSREICNPPVLDTDDDTVLLVADLREFTLKAVAIGFEIGGSDVMARVDFEHESQKFVSLTCVDDNLIVVDDDSFFERFMLATRVAKKLNVATKENRIVLFQAILYGNG